MEEKLIIGLADIHSAEYCSRSLNTALDYMKVNKPNMVILMGDLLVNEDVSPFSRTAYSSAVPFIKERQLAWDILKKIQDAAPDAEYVMLASNHDSDRWGNFMMKKIPELATMEELSFQSIMKLDEFKITWVDQRKNLIEGKPLFKTGRLHWFHGNEAKLGWTSVNYSRLWYMKFRVPSVHGHIHSTAMHLERTIDGQLHDTYSVGCLCKLRPSYNATANWNNGMVAALVNVKHQTHQVKNLIINNSRIMNDF